MKKAALTTIFVFMDDNRRESTYFSHLCEMGLPGFPLRVIMGACCIRKLRNNPAS